MQNNLQCPQCGAASSTKISATEYHCVYCDSNFKVGLSKEELLASLMEKSQSSKINISTRLEELKAAGIDPQVAKRRGTILLLCVFAFVICLVGGILFAAKSASSSSSSSYWQDPSTNRFQVFMGSKGAVAWYIQETSSKHLDSAKFTLKIIDPKNSTVLKEMNYVPVMTWKDGFSSNEFIGDFFGFGDTCWISSERDGLIARNIYTGEIIIDAQKLGKIYPPLATGVSKSRFSTNTNTFEITSGEGLEFVFDPKSKQLLSKDDFEKANHTVANAHTFFIVSEGLRPHLFKTVENTSPFAADSKVFSSQLEEYNGTNFRAQFNDDVTSVEKLNPDRVYFNGKVAWQNGDKAVILFQENSNKKSALHISCVDATGKETWKLNEKDILDFSNAFANNNYGLSFISSKDKLLLFIQYPVIEVIQVDLGSGKINWRYKDAK